MDLSTHGVVDLKTGQLVGGEGAERSGDTRFHFEGGGRWASFGKPLLSRIWAKGSGYTKNDKLVVGFYLGATQVGLKPVPLTKQEIARELEIRPASAGESMNRLARGNILIPVQKFGAIWLFRLNARLVYDGGSEQQRECAKYDPVPIVPLKEEA
ncbi:hypothetical protein [Streptomyces antimicrobicus]|uniref:Uncharacterized protein n=1 Tax=Streptomyces antimicrobicus TaxID=2883108 RepID=A0ABS8BA33_9ACTN|nr:hypothetical protein [Streptomyces antimicrobicus]MCB5181489.1 hypothetical protein [Streptomyces antimicrobicus]